MFGYVRPCRPELKIREDALYKSYYCGVCRTLGKRSGPLCRALLRYDLAFVALVRAGVCGDAALRTLRCPVKGARLNLAQGGSIDYAADAHLLLTAAKLRDDRQDGAGLGAALLGGALGPATRRAAAALPRLHAELARMMREQAELERAICADPDDAAAPFARFTGELFALDSPPEAQAALRFMGYNVGKWVYWLDALDDFDRDAQKGSYNVWRAAGYDRAAACGWALPLLAQCCAQAQAAFDAVDLRDEAVRPLVDNVLREGMPRVMDAVAQGRRWDDGSI